MPSRCRIAARGLLRIGDVESRAQDHRYYIIGQMIQVPRSSFFEISRAVTVDRLISRTLRSVMQNKDLLWVRPDFAAGKIAPENPSRPAKRKATKSEPFVDDGTLGTFTVAQIASMWQYSTDTIQRWFEDEPGVIASGEKNPRGKRKRVTLRIPRAVMERVKKRHSNR
jgi:hypothetical protein